MKQLVVLWLLIFNNLLLAQFSLSSRLSSYYTDNLYLSPQKTEDFVSSIDLNLIYESTTWPISLTIYPEFYSYFDHADQNFILGAASMEYFPFLDQNKLWQLYSALSIVGRFNTAEFDLYNYQQYQFMFAIYHDGAIALNQISYQFQVRNYNQFDALSNITHYFNWKFNKSFKTRTSIITTLGFASRTYESQNRFIVISDTITSDRGIGRGHSQRPPRVITQQVPLSTGATTLNQLSFSLRIAQNVLPNFGLYVQYLRTFDLSSSGDFQNYGSYLGDDELFDDPLSYLSDEWSSQITYLLGDWQLKFNSSYNNKNYLNEKAFLSESDSIATGSTRKDQKLDFYLTLSRAIQIKETLTFNITGQLYYIHNQSNSYWYDYQNLISGLSLKIIY